MFRLRVITSPSQRLESSPLRLSGNFSTTVRAKTAEKPASVRSRHKSARAGFFSMAVRQFNTDICSDSISRIWRNSSITGRVISSSCSRREAFLTGAAGSRCMSRIW